MMLLAVCALVLTACDRNLVYEAEGECIVTYNLRFVYNKNLKWADAFPSEVHSVHLYAFDSNGLFVKEFVANGEAVDSEDYTMQLDLVAGRYTLVAWCGMDNAGVTEKSFTVPSPVAGKTRIEELTCALNVKTRAELCSDTKLNFLYHGILDVDLPDVHNGDFNYTIYLTKDTNHFRIILQQLSAEDMDPDEFEFKIEDANGLMGHDNRMLATETVTYRPWSVRAVSAGMVPEGEEDDELVDADGLVVDISTSRLMANHQKEMMLTINSKDKQIARVPILQYALMTMEYFKDTYDPTLTEQDFLDRADEYVFTFFLDDTQRWIKMYINIQEWRVVYQKQEM